MNAYTADEFSVFSTRRIMASGECYPQRAGAPSSVVWRKHERSHQRIPFSRKTLDLKVMFWACIKLPSCNGFVTKHIYSANTVSKAYHSLPCSTAVLPRNAQNKFKASMRTCRVSVWYGNCNLGPSPWVDKPYNRFRIGAIIIHLIITSKENHSSFDNNNIHQTKTCCSFLAPPPPQAERDDCMHEALGLHKPKYSRQRRTANVSRNSETYTVTDDCEHAN
jgi:hypothetical protein